MNEHSPSFKIKDLSDIPAVRAYLDRFGATPRGRRKAVIREPVGKYFKDVAVITLNEDGTVDAPDGFKPTDDQAAAIKAACVNVRWPELKPVDNLRTPGKLPAQIEEAEREHRLFKFYDQQGKIVMLQVRKELDGGDKKYMPWTYWSDDQWLNCEPEGLLPLWGLDQLKGATTVFLHEGAKAARAMAELFDPNAIRSIKDKAANHPWAVKLSNSAHLGWIGGAPNPHRTDWSVLNKAELTRVYIVSDNDEPGVKAFKPIADEIRCPTYHIEFTKQWDEGFDLADEFPANMFKEIDGVKHYVGPSFWSCCFSIIELEAGKLSKIADEGEEALKRGEVPIFRRGEVLVRPVVEKVKAADGRETSVAQLKRVDQIYMRDLLSRRVYWRKASASAKGKRVFVDPPMETAATILGRVGEWKFRPMVGVITTPTLRPDGSLLRKPGYDEETRLLLVDPPQMPHIPDVPMKDDALAALALIEDLLSEFPFEDDVARAVALSALISPVVRGAFEVVPMHAARAPTAGSGKSYLFDLAAAIAIGEPMPVMAAGANEEETEKRLGAALMAGQPLISIDNVNGDLKSDALCQAIERPIVEIRILGKSERVRIDSRSTSLFANGNNIAVVGDLCRRALIVWLDPKTERPELREFSSDPMGKVLANRGAYIAAALTICRAYIVAGRPDKKAPLASFKGWSDTVRSALIWLGMADPVEFMKIAREEDPELVALRGMLSAWAEVFGVGWENRKTLKEAIEAVEKFNPCGPYEQPRPQHPALRSAVFSIAKGQKADARQLGNWVRRYKGRYVGNLRFNNKSEDKGGSEWWIERGEDPI